MHWKSETCLGRLSGKPLTTYDSLGAAQDGAAYAEHTYGNAMTAYRCDTCELWHLAPADRQTPSRTSACLDGSGRPKRAYVSRQAAARRAEIIRAEGGPTLTVYDCRDCGEWHLTKGYGGW